MKYLRFSVITNTYYYSGPAYRFGQCVGNFEYYTSAKSFQQAENNIRHKIRMELGLVKNSNLTIDSNLIQVVKNEEIVEQEETGVEVEQLSLF